MSGFPVLSVHNLKVIAKFGPLEKLLHGFIPLEKLLHAFIPYINIFIFLSKKHDIHEYYCRYYLL